MSSVVKLSDKNSSQKIILVNCEVNLVYTTITKNNMIIRNIKVK